MEDQQTPENPTNEVRPEEESEEIDVTEIIARLDAIEKLAAERAQATSGFDDRLREIEAKVTELVEFCNSLGDDE